MTKMALIWASGKTEVPGVGWLVKGQRFEAKEKLGQELIYRGYAKAPKKSAKKKTGAKQEV
jgi:hypothetical protein